MQPGNSLLSCLYSREQPLNTKGRFNAEDLAQEIAVAVLHAWQSGERPANFNAWLWAVARNCWLKYLERQRRICGNVPYIEGGQVPAMPMTQSGDFDVEPRVALCPPDCYAACRSGGNRQAPVARRTITDQEGDGGDAGTRVQELCSSATEPVGRLPDPNYWHDLEKTVTRNILAAAHDEPASVPELSAE